MCSSDLVVRCLTSRGWELPPTDEDGRPIVATRSGDWRSCYVVDEVRVEEVRAELLEPLFDLHLLRQEPSGTVCGPRGGAARRLRGKQRSPDKAKCAPSAPDARASSAAECGAETAAGVPPVLRRLLKKQPRPDEGKCAPNAPDAQASSAADCRKRRGTAATPPPVRRRLNVEQSAGCEQKLRELGGARVVRERAEQPGLDLVHGQRDRYESEFCFEMDMSEASWSCDGGSDLDIGN